MKKEIKNMIGKDGKLPAYAWPGGYPIYYLDAENCLLCPDCASREEEYTEETVAYGINWEDNYAYCEDCNKHIESAYGEEE